MYIVYIYNINLWHGAVHFCSRQLSITIKNEEGMAVPLTAASVGRSLSGSLWVCWKRWRQERIMKDLLSGPNLSKKFGWNLCQEQFAIQTFSQRKPT